LKARVKASTEISCTSNTPETMDGVQQARYEAFVAVKIQVEVFWVVMELQPRRPRLECPTYALGLAICEKPEGWISFFRIMSLAHCTTCTFLTMTSHNTLVSN